MTNLMVQVSTQLWIDLKLIGITTSPCQATHAISSYLWIDLKLIGITTGSRGWHAPHRLHAHALNWPETHRDYDMYRMALPTVPSFFTLWIDLKLIGITTMLHSADWSPQRASALNWPKTIGITTLGTRQDLRCVCRPLNWPESHRDYDKIEISRAKSMYITQTSISSMLYIYLNFKCITQNSLLT